jgi:hypothetical protein
MQNTHKSVRPPVVHPPTESAKADAAGLARLLNEWMQGDAEEQKETFEALRKGLDEHRPDGYKLFP